MNGLPLLCFFQTTSSNSYAFHLKVLGGTKFRWHTKTLYFEGIFGQLLQFTDFLGIKLRIRNIKTNICMKIWKYLPGKKITPLFVKGEFSGSHYQNYLPTIISSLSKSLGPIFVYTLIGESFARLKLPEFCTFSRNKCVKTKE